VRSLISATGPHFGEVRSEVFHGPIRGLLGLGVGRSSTNFVIFNSFHLLYSIDNVDIKPMTHG
jgi:hypothetical protein